MSARIVIVGGGPAAVMAAIAARKQDAAASVTLLTDEACEPYEKPPLSKGVLTGKAQPEDAPIAGRAGLAAQGVAIRHRARCVAIDRAERTVALESGERLPYDRLVLASLVLGRRIAKRARTKLGAGPIDYTRFVYRGANVAFETDSAGTIGLRYVWGGNSTTNGMDCSAYVSWVWGVSRYTTDSIWAVSHFITKNELRAGDAMNLTIGRDPQRRGHIRIFEAWANEARTLMWVYEETPPRAVQQG